MERLEVYNELISLADAELKKIEDILPKDPISSFALFTETTRVSDYLQLGNPEFSTKYGFSFQELDIMKMGWNLGASLLFKLIQVQGFPIRESTKTTRSRAASLLFHLGCISLLRRSAEMVKSGLMSSEKKDDTFTFTMTSIASTQFLDEMELSHLSKMEEEIKSAEKRYYKGWNLVDIDNLEKIFREPGNFLSVNKNNRFSDFKLNNIDSEMLPLIKPWDSGYGIMMGYDSTPEIDDHFLAIATESIGIWRNETGFHPNTKIGDITGAEVMAIAAFVVSFHLKHVHFASLASKNYPEISIPPSLTIWGPLDEMIRDISEFSGMDSEVVSKALHVIMIKPRDVRFLRTYTSKFMPLLIDMGNGFILRPVSSVLRNPLNFILDLLKSRDSKFRQSISAPRENWLRTDLYALFAGSRYQRVRGHVKLRKENDIVTDIDAAVYDNLTGELALFQIKWQNYFLNDVKKLRSKARNFTNELDQWAGKVSNWIKSQSTSRLSRSLRLKNVTQVKISNIYLFGISRNAARMQGYGYELETENIAVSTWAQFVRNRNEIGPTEGVISSIYKTLKKQENDTISTNPMPIEISIGDKVLHYKDLWNSVEH